MLNIKKAISGLEMKKTMLYYREKILMEIKAMALNLILLVVHLMDLLVTKVIRKERSKRRRQLKSLDKRYLNQF